MSASDRNKLDTESLHQTPAREQWVHEESGRRFSPEHTLYPEPENLISIVQHRTITVLLMINLMLDCLLEPERNTYETSCRNNIETILLPATRDLWEAPTNFIWRTEYERYLSRRKTTKTLKVGDLLRLNEVGNFKDMSVSHGDLDIVPDILAWCEGLDSLGSLLWMIVPFQQWRMTAGMSEVW
jgi:hypothetical protein